MNDEETLLDGIRERPNDDEPRLVYADWLDDHGKSALADFMRCQIMAARLPGGDPHRCKLAERAAEICQKYRQEWEQPVRRHGVAAVGYDRGLPIVTISAQAFLDHADRLFAENPGVIGVSITDGEPGQLQGIMASPRLEGLTHLYLRGNHIDDDGVRALINSPYLKCLKHLDLGFNNIGFRGARALANSPHLQNLTDLRLPYNDIRSSGVMAIASSPYFHDLTYLDLGRNSIGNGGAEALAKSTNLGKLTRLALVHNNINDAGARAFASSPHLRNLKHLHLGRNDIGPAARGEIGRSLESRAEQNASRGR